MAAQNQQDNPPPKTVKHLDMVVTVSYFCSNCGEELGTMDEFKIKEAGGRGEVPAEAMDCTYCQVPVAHKKLVITEPV